MFLVMFEEEYRPAVQGKLQAGTLQERIHATVMLRGVFLRELMGRASWLEKMWANPMLLKAADTSGIVREGKGDIAREAA